jgi:drug/metabolite transporter (DMT)-like permease
MAKAAHLVARHRAASLFGILAAVLWGISFLSTKVAVAAIPPMTLATVQFGLACLALPPIALLAGEDLRVAPRDGPILALAGILGITLFYYCQNHGLLELSASESALIIATVPIASVIADRVFLGTRLSRRVYAGSLLSVAGVGLIVIQPSIASPSSLKGYLYMFGAVIAWVAYSLATHRVAGRCGRLSITFWQCLFGTFFCIPFALGESAGWRWPTPIVVFNVLYLGLMVSVVAFWLIVATIAHLGVGKASLFINLIPVVAAVAGYFILGDRLGILQGAGGAIVLTGVYLAMAPKRTRLEV